MALEKYSLEIEKNLVYLCFSLAWWAYAIDPTVQQVRSTRDEQQQQHPMPESEKSEAISINNMKKILWIITSEMTKITLQIRLFIISMVHLML